MKEKKLNELYREYRERYSNEQIVLGEGNPDAELLMIGEAPGKYEVELGKPFVGAAGKNLSHFLDLMNLRRESIFITNAIKYRLSQVNPKTGRLVNRPARSEEILENREYLLREIEIIKPFIIVTLGNVPLKAVTGDMSASVGEIHGRLLSFCLGNSNYCLFPLYHPASIIYNRNLSKTYEDDIMKLKTIYFA